MDAYAGRAASVVPDVPSLHTQVVVEDASEEATPEGWFEYEDALSSAPFINARIFARSLYNSPVC